MAHGAEERGVGAPIARRRLQGEEADEAVAANRDPEVGAATPLVKIIEVPQAAGAASLLVSASKARADHRSLVTSLARWPWGTTSPRVRGLVLLNLVSERPDVIRASVGQPQ